MKVALIGASGFIGSRLLAELSARGHAVTAIVRNPEKVAGLPGATAVKGDVFDKDGLAKLLAGHDAVISAVHFSASDPQVLLASVRQSGVTRYLVVGGAGSLEVAPGVKLFDTPEFPAVYLDEARKGGAFLDLLKQEQGLDWTFLSPSALIQPGERTGKFRLGTDQLLVDAKGSSAISAEDYAIALVDELEKPAHGRRRFTVGY
ncbi:MULTISPECIES: NAD(P)-dependent oxidoreductase [Bosea]|uniref:NAD(P)-dependent oxidoreductase n=1 Tax=Bosea TaxID=85413 RepID=UPI00214FF6DE|nr:MULTISPECIES: NAD(P)-dependent oxidoreductase [Bosea]MCR4524373.1 NAD(P)-dependent oxidoreductase [Bosea sp. 47.2.35]MDR6831659.1 putative NADH-flavin reductase [Bosea robiniae]MDR6898367.1 putative NADH-flavin reductase [Bosea sp. BE109]MDR7141765.1 putative NADH-flavin reductase [Bosea sp. BE168]MDR7178374.1 putative NADH-flavin reductase [Bosea sp. BE271]